MRNPTTLTQKELSLMKHTLFEMVQTADHWNEPDYLVLALTLKNLTFRENSLDSYAGKVHDVVESMIDLDDLAWDVVELYRFQEKLK